jgi:4-alpha-glucanotransferase
MFPDDPEHASPYSPATRYFLNILYIDVEAVPEFADCRAAKTLLRSDGFRRALANCRSGDHVDYAEVTRLKMQALRIAHAEFSLNASTERRRLFSEFVRAGDENLETASLFQVLRDYFVQRDAANADWHRWPEPFRSAASREVQEFAKQHRSEIEFLNWLQWIADRQLAAAKAVAIRAGMRIGFYRDLAVGCDRTGSETWARPADFMVGAEIGAPPDILNPSGQNWGLPPFNPIGLRKHRYSPFADLVRANMRHAGGLRIDHVMGLQRLYCIPHGSPADQGAYVSYPVADLIGILALESHRHRCFVVGEDLGTVPEGFRELMSQVNILSYRVMFFEQGGEAGQFLPPEEYPRLAVAVAGSHDLPTLRGWLSGKDIELKDRLRLYSSAEETASQLAMREQERAGVLEALGLAGGRSATEELFEQAVHRFLGSTNCMLAMTQLDDLLGEPEPVNVPATSTEHPNWRRRYSASIEDLGADHPAWKLVEIMKAGRRRQH